MTSPVLLEVRDLSFVHPGRALGLETIELRVRGGEILTILGPSGSGKTTLLRLLAGELTPTTGRIEIAGRRLLPRPGGGFPEIGYQMQFAERQFFAPSVREEVAFAVRRRGSGEADVEAAVGRALRAVGLPASSAFGARAPWSLSLGEQRRVALASVLVFEPAVLLLDEPSASLDPAGRADLASGLRRLSSAGVGIIMVGHDLRWSTPISSHLGLLDGSRLRSVDIRLEGDRERLIRAGYRLPASWAFFERRIRRFWVEGGWRLREEELAVAWARQRGP